MKRSLQAIVLIILLIILTAVPLLAQGKRLWVLRASGEMVEIDPVTFATRQTIKVPSEVVRAPQNLSVNHLGQMLFAVPLPLPLADSEEDAVRKVWFWDGHAAANLDQAVSYKTAEEGSNTVITESAPVPYLSFDGAHLYWFADEARRMQREDVDLSTTTTWRVWTTDLAGANREDLTTSKLPECRCTTGACDETCPYAVFWTPQQGTEKFFMITEVMSGQTQPVYEDSARYEQQAGKWTANPVTPPLRRVLDAAPDGTVLLEAIPDTGCCGWVNQSDDQTVVRNNGKTVNVFDEVATYKNPDYDVSFYTSNALLSPALDSVAMTITATAQPNKPIQLSEQGQANPAESLRIRKALVELPAVEVKTLGDSPKRAAFLPHATLVGWISEKEVLILEDHLLVAVNVATSARRKSSIRVEDAGKVFLR